MSLIFFKWESGTIQRRTRSYHGAAVDESRG